MSKSIDFIERTRDGELYTVNFFDTPIRVTVTSAACVVRKWIRTTIYLRRNYFGRLVVGVGVQWNPFISGYVPAHTLQLCVGTRCLIFQLSIADSVPRLLRRFLKDRYNTFVGLWNGGDRRRLRESRHELEIHKLLDMRKYVKTEDGQSLAKASVEVIVEECLGYRGVRVDKDVSMSDWDAKYLSHAQILQACIDAHVSFLIGRDLRAWKI